MKTSSENKWAFKVLAGNYISEEDLEGLGISADWHLYLSPTEPPSAAQCNQQMNAYDLSACPCCGGRATIIGTLKTCEWSAICTMCGLETAHMIQPKDAAAAWNRRYAPDDAGEDFEALSDSAKDRIGIPFPAPPATQQPAGEAVADFHDTLYGAKVKLYLDPENDESSVSLCIGATFGPNDNLEIMLHAVDDDGGVVKLYTHPAPQQPGAKGDDFVKLCHDGLPCEKFYGKQPDPAGEMAGLVEKWQKYVDAHDGQYAYIEGVKLCLRELEDALDKLMENRDER